MKLTKINLPSWHVQCSVIVIFAIILLVVVERVDLELVSFNTVVFANTSPGEVTAAVVSSG